MKFSKEKFDLFMEKIWTSPRKCPICSSNDWKFNDTIFSLSELSVENSTIHFPVIVVTCKKCGHAHFFNIFQSGLYTQDEVLSILKSTKKQDNSNTKETSPRGMEK